MSPQLVSTGVLCVQQVDFGRPYSHLAQQRGHPSAVIGLVLQEVHHHTQRA